MVGTIKQICMFIVCAQMILHFKPSQKYEKYIKLLIGIMVLVQLLLPVMLLVYPESESDLADRMRRYETEVFGAIAGNGEKELIDEEKISEMRMEEIKSILNNSNVDTEAGMYKASENSGQFAKEEIMIERIEVNSDD